MSDRAPEEPISDASSSKESRSPLEGESLMLILHPVFLVATIAHLIGFGAKWLWRKVFENRPAP